jgi:WD40 repeat protein/serine/threonine protein kinase
VALKVLPFHGLLGPTQLERFKREAKAAARLHHTNIVPVFGVGEDSRIHYYAMQFIQGQSLDTILSELRRLRSAQGQPTVADPSPGVSLRVAQGLLSGRFAKPEPSAEAASPEAAPATGRPTAPCPGVPQPSAVTASGLAYGYETEACGSSHFINQSEAQYFRSVAQVGVQVAEALAYAHRQGILHRDIKPSNLLLDLQGSVWITDFGLAKAEGSDELTHTGDIVGTLRFMAPERFEGRCDRRSEVYSVGITLYELLTLRPAFEASDRPRLIERVLHEDPPRLRKLDPRIPRDLETIVLKAMAKDPAERYPTAEKLAEDLRRFLADRPIRARRTSALERAWRWCRRNPAVATLSGSVALLVVLVAIGSSVAAVSLSANLQRAEHAEREKTEKLLESYLNQARAGRRSGRSGRRFDSLAALTEAAKIARELEMPEDRSRELLLEMRNETIACTAVVDLRLGKQWDGLPSWGAVVFDMNLQRYARGDAKGNISVRRVADDQELVRLPGAGAPSWAFIFSPDGQFLAAIYESGTFHIWDLNRGEPVVKVAAGACYAGLDFTLDSRSVAVGWGDSTIRLYDLPSGKEKKTVRQGDVPYSLAFHPNGRLLAVSTHNTSAVQVRDVETDKVIATLAHSKRVRGMAWRPDGKLLATACGDLHIHVWDVDSQKRIAVLEGHEAEPTTVAFSHSGSLLASTGWDASVRLWDPLAKKQLISTAGGFCNGFPRFQFSPDDRSLAFSWDGGSKLGLWEVADGRECREFHSYLGVYKGPWSIDFSPDGRLLASAYSDGVRLWDFSLGRELAHLPRWGSCSALIHPTGTSLITHTNNGLDRWPIETDLKAPGAGFRVGPPQRLLDLSLAWKDGSREGRNSFSSRGRMIAVTDRPRAQLIILDLQGQTEKVVLPDHANIQAAIIHPGGRWIASILEGERVASIQVSDVRTKEMVWKSTCLSATFSPDGKWLVTSLDQECRFWEVGSWRLDKVIRRDTPSLGRAFVMAFSRDSKLLAIAYEDRVVRLIEASTGKELATLTAPNPRPITWLCFSPDDRQLAVACGNHVIQAWDLRLIRERLAAMDLDWDLSPYPPTAKTKHDSPLKAEVDCGDLAKPNPMPSPEERARQAIERYRRAVAANPNDPKACNNLAWAYATAPEALRDVKEALRLAQKAVQLEPKNPVYQNTLGLASYRAGEYRQAADTLRANLKGQEDRYLAFDLYILAMSYHKLGEAERAREYFDWAVRWSRTQKDLSPQHAEELDAFRAEAESVLGKTPEP